MIRIVVADDQELMREGLSVILGRQGDIEVVGEATNGREAIARVHETHPDVLLLDVRMPVLDGVGVVRALRQGGFERLSILILTTFDLDDVVFDALRAGASGFLLKDSPRDQLLHAIRAAATGETQLAPAITARLVERFVNTPRQAGATPPELERLTSRERDVLRLLAAGRSNGEIAANLVLSDPTVKTHVASILRKLGLRDRTHAVVWAYESGYVVPGKSPDSDV